jgi:hypothetical protein
VARIRSIKPQFFLNEDVAALPYQWRLLFIGLWTQADRDGRLEDRPVRLKAMIFPYDDLDVNDGLGCLANANLITRYEGNGLRLISIRTWAKHQQPHVKEQQSEYPPPLTDRDQKPGVSPVQEPLIRIREQIQEGNRSSTALRAAFDQFWAVYPRKTAKDVAWSVWLRLKPNSETVAAIMSAVQVQAKNWNDPQFIPHARTWLNQKRWNDEVTPMRQVPTFVSRREPWVCPHLTECSSERICANATACNKPRKTEAVL